jgi:hypothetical protein
MIRVCKFEMDGVELQLASMSLNEADAFVKKSKSMLREDRTVDPTADEWLELQIDLVHTALAKAMGDKAPAKDKMRDEMDLPLINALYVKLLEFSGLRATGEVTAVSSSPKSAAA